MVKRILVVGVGGQGTLLTSRVLGAAAAAEGCDVKLSEVHGMAQRGGSVVTHISYGEAVGSPIIDRGLADVIIAFEELEALRYIDYLKPSGVLFVNAQRIMPLPVAAGAAVYPGDIRERIAQRTENAVYVDAAKLASDAGSVRAVNIVMVGVAAAACGLSEKSLLQAIEGTVKPEFLELNKRAFQAGRAERKD